MIKISYKLKRQDAIRIKEASQHVAETFANFNFDFMLNDLANCKNIKAISNTPLLISKIKNLEACPLYLEMVFGKNSKNDSILISTNKANYLLAKEEKHVFTRSFLKMTLFSLSSETSKFVVFFNFGSQKYPYFFNFQIGGEDKTNGSLKRYLTYFLEFDNSLRLPFYKKIKKEKLFLEQTSGEYFYKNIKKLFSIKIPDLEEIPAFDFSKVRKTFYLADTSKINNKNQYSSLVYGSPVKNLGPEELFFNLNSKNVLTLYCFSKKITDEELAKMVKNAFYPNLWFKTLYREYLYGRNILSTFSRETLMQF